MNIVKEAKINEYSEPKEYFNKPQLNYKYKGTFEKVDVDKIKIVQYNDNSKLFFIMLNDENVGQFTIERIGNIKLDPNNSFKLENNKKTFNNSIFLEGGFIINEDFRYKGIGREVIKKIFNKFNCDNIFLYAIEDQNAIRFWLKIGGKILLKQNSLVYIQINKNNLK